MYISSKSSDEEKEMFSAQVEWLFRDLPPSQTDVTDKCIMIAVRLSVSYLIPQHVSCE